MSNSLYRMFLILLGSFLGAVVFLVSASLFIGHPVSELVLSAHAGLLVKPEKQLDAKDVQALQSLLEQGAIISSDSLIENVTNFYTSLINQLIALLGLFGLISYMYIKISSTEQAEKQVNEFLSSAAFNAIIEEKTESKFRDQLSLIADDYMTELEMIKKKVNSLDKKIDKVIEKISLRDDTDSEGLELELND